MMRTKIWVIRILLSAVSVSAAASTIDFAGYTFKLYGAGTATANSDGTLTFSQNAGQTGDVGLVLYSSFNFASLSYLDNVNTNIDLFLQCCAGAGIHPPDVRITSGSESSFAVIGNVSIQYPTL